MPTGLSATSVAAAPLRPYERGAAALCHLSTIVPFWALIANGVLYFTYRESSRIVCLHARQGINFQIMFLLAWIAKAIVDMFARLVAQVGVPDMLVRIIETTGDYALLAVFLIYAAICLYGALQALRGRIFIYPIAGRRLYENYLRTANEW